MDLPLVFIALGGLFLAGLAADWLGRRTRLPRVTLLLILGVIAGEAGAGLLPEVILSLSDPLSVLALTVVAFLLGGTLQRSTLRAHGTAILLVSGGVVLITLAVVAGGLIVLGVAAPLALVLGAMATATDPAATLETLRDSGARGPFADILRGVVAVDDAWGMIVFALALVGAQSLTGGGVALDHLGAALWEVGGAVGLGVAIGLPAAWLTGRLRAGEPMLIEALGVVCLIAGLALWLHVSYLLAAMTAGAVIVNTARHHDRAFHEIEQVEWPFLLLFFLLAGAQLDPAALGALGVAGLGYVGLRIAGRGIGGWAGARAAGLAPPTRRWIGPALLPQAGVAVGMALVAAETLRGQHGDTLVTLAIATTVLFELIGPLATAQALRRAATDDPEPNPDTPQATKKGAP